MTRGRRRSACGWRLLVCLTACCVGLCGSQSPAEGARPFPVLASSSTSSSGGGDQEVRALAVPADPPGLLSCGLTKYNCNF